jgi:hypothetical protein
MTVTIGALCDATARVQQANIVMCADTLVSYCSGGAPISGNIGGTKLYDLPHGFYAAISDDISRCHQVISFLYNEMDGIKHADPRFLDLVKVALDRTAEYVRLWMRREVLADYGVSLKEFLGKKKLVERFEIASEIRSRAISTQITIGGFGHNLSPILLFTDCINIQEQTNPGFFCAGAGMGAALDWLNFRQQNCFMSTQRTFYHIREAKQYAEVCPVVGGLNHTILLRPNKPFENLSVVTPLLEGWVKAMYPRFTDSLDKGLAREQFMAAYGIK